MTFDDSSNCWIALTERVLARSAFGVPDWFAPAAQGDDSVASDAMTQGDMHSAEAGHR